MNERALSFRSSRTAVPDTCSRSSRGSAPYESNVGALNTKGATATSLTDGSRASHRSAHAAVRPSCSFTGVVSSCAGQHGLAQVSTLLATELACIAATSHCAATAYGIATANNTISNRLTALLMRRNTSLKMRPCGESHKPPAYSNFRPLKAEARTLRLAATAFP